MPAAESTVACVPVPPEFTRALRELNLAAPLPLLGELTGQLMGEPLTGGVSSDIWRIQTAQGSVCAKRALAKLRVAADWRAPVERNRYEARWMQVAHEAAPGHVPRVLGQHEGLGVLVMEHLPPSEHRLWKTELREGHADIGTARAVGAVLARIHGYAAARPALAAHFDSQQIFFDIRLEPYLLATAARHAELAGALRQLVAVTQAHGLTLVHGDVSPKNILIGPRGPVLLDAECATWGDPAFDLAFCLNHLLLKCLWNPPATGAFAVAFGALADAYLQGVDWELPAELERRAAALLPGLLLARVDGKSPVEYVTQDVQRERVRRFASALLRQPLPQLAQVCAAWLKELAQPMELAP